VVASSKTPGPSCRFRGGVRDTQPASRRWLRPCMLSPVRCNRLPVTEVQVVGKPVSARPTVSAESRRAASQERTKSWRRIRALARRAPSTGRRLALDFPANPQIVRKPHHPVWHHRPRVGWVMSAVSAVKLAVNACSPAAVIDHADIVRTNSFGDCIFRPDAARECAEPFRARGLRFLSSRTPPLAWPHGP
jgi:hypothetical protein